VQTNINDVIGVYVKHYDGLLPFYNTTPEALYTLSVLSAGTSVILVISTIRKKTKKTAQTVNTVYTNTGVSV
jgi:formate-dependent nitrite reductase membrane component NrfD